MNYGKAVFLGALMLSLLGGCTGAGSAAETDLTTATEISSTTESASSQTDTSSSSAQSMSQSEIQSSLDAEGNKVYDVTWSPDNAAVVFIRQDTEASNIYVWKTGESAAALLYAAEDTTSGFLWSPDSNYFLVDVGHMGPGTITITLIDADSLKEVDSNITTSSVSPPVWSPDSQSLALSVEAEDGSGTVYLIVYSVQTGSSATLLEQTNAYGPFAVTSWDADGTISYTEVTATGDRTTAKTIQAPTT
ncbi:MAG: hypothetical protein H6Q60_1571 [Oscillospiraceae bacterium]|nr:hypothetical protein [Oscillospiraceae bacterium]